MTGDHDCGHDWCIAPHEQMCDCPYSNAQPHNRDGCHYARDDEDDDAESAA